jgi:iron complex outermembrane receptor protein
LYRKNFHSFPNQRNNDPCWEWADKLAAGVENDGITQEMADNCAAEGIPDNIHSLISMDVVTGGGASVLDAETSTSDSIGVIWTAQALDLRVSVDYFEVEVEDQIGAFAAEDILNGCYESETFPDDLLCSLIVREEPGVPIEQYRVKTVESSYVNLDTQRVEGWDIEASYGTDLPNGMGLSFVTSHTIMTTKETVSTAGVITSRLGRAGDPKWVGNLTTRLSKDNWAATWRVNFVDGTDNNRPGLATSDTWTGASGEEETYYFSRTLESRTYHHLSFNYRFGEGWAADLGVTNVTDELPPRASQGDGLRVEGYGAFHSQYDWKGRRYGLNIKKTF